MGLLITQILEVFNDYNKTICPGFYKAYLQAKRLASPKPAVAGRTEILVQPESADCNDYLTPAQKMSAKYCAEALCRLNGMPKVGSQNKLGMYTDQYMEGVITDWEYIERVVEAAETALESANQLLYKSEED